MKIKKNESEENQRRVNLEEWYKNNGNLNRATSVPALKQLQDSLIARNFGEPQRLAILATSAQEMDKKGAASKGIGGNGMLGYSSERMPTKYLDDTEEGRAKQIHFLIEDMLTTHSDNWLDGGSGGPYIKNGKSAYNQFWNGTDATLLTKIFNKSLIRPRDREDAWDNRATVANNMSNYMYQKGGLVYNPFVPETKMSKQVIDEPTFQSLKISDYTRFPVEPVKTYSIPKETPAPQQVTTQIDNTKVEQSKITKEEAVMGKVYKSDEKQQFKTDIYNAYYDALLERGLDTTTADAFAKRISTQDVLESRWGQSSLSKDFNFGGIKDFSGNGVQKDTTEYINGVKKSVKQPFRKFKDLKDYVNYKLNLVDKNWNVFKYNPDSYYTLITSGKKKYATDPNYVAKLNDLYKQIW